ncbi:MAG: GreA/GreB family elongation factor, partial [Verrucomicrobia bacterium]|nr:GreA/GreB family elongation factor [Verrucomicrobiota bacterium]
GKNAAGLVAGPFAQDIVGIRFSIRMAQGHAGARACHSGDLSENFEYKSAKETQGILLRRQSELESQLASVKSTDFEQFPATVAGPGTRVTLRHADGKTNTYYILGEWDSDEARGILSLRCKFGEAITGHQPGDTVTIPSETGNTVCTLVEVGGLPPDIKAWIRGDA